MFAFFEFCVHVQVCVCVFAMAMLNCHHYIIRPYLVDLFHMYSWVDKCGYQPVTRWDDPPYYLLQ